MSATLSYIPDRTSREDGFSDAEAGADVGHGWVLKLMQKEGPGILRLLWRLLGRESDVMDAYQDCFCKLATKAERRSLRSARAYLYRTASNVAIEMLRVRKRRREHWPAVVATAAGNRGEEAGPPTEGGQQAALREAIVQLPAHLRNVVVLRDLSRKPYEEVGRILGIRPATARVYRRHAVVKLAELLEGGDVS
jgi:RNA polymerase sigma-70 factor (ECF subfamily)